MSEHKWITSPLSHGEVMCSKCFMTNREANALGAQYECEYPEDRPGTAREAPSTFEGSGVINRLEAKPAGHPIKHPEPPHDP